jgi:hypothetical protein
MAPPPRRIAARAPTVRATSWLVVAGHGGAGASTVAALLHEAAGLDAALEAAGARRAQLLQRPRQVLLVARATAYGTASAALALGALPPTFTPVLVLVADSPLPDPPAVRYRLRALGARLAGTVRIDYLPAARGIDDPRELASSPAGRRAAAALLRQLAALHTPQALNTHPRSQT